MSSVQEAIEAVDGWQDLGYTCPECGQATLVLVRHGLDCAERCPQCDWEVRFNDEENVSWQVEE